MGEEKRKKKDLFLTVEGIDLLFGNKLRSLKEPLHKKKYSYVKVGQIRLKTL